jgi:predicted permease
MDTLVQDLRFGLRQLRKSPAFTLAAVLTLALGIGANTTVFNWLNSVIFNPLPGVDSSSLVYIRWRTPDGGGQSFSWPDYLDYRKRNQTLQGLIVGRMIAMSLGDGSQQQVNRVWGMLVSANYFETMGVQAAMGRTFLPEEDEKPGGHPVVVISHHCWQTRFGGDPQIVGKQIRLNKQNFTVVGVTPEPFQGSTLGLSFEMWVPAIMQPTILGGAGSLDQRGSRWLDGWARLKPGVTPARAEEDLTVISAQITREFSKSDSYPRARTTPIWKEGGGRMLAPVMILMMAVVGVVLLIACANISNLLLARSAARRREIAVRLALGVSRARLVRQLMIESGLLAVFGCAAAMAMVPVTSGMLQGFTPVSDFPVGLTVRPDGGVFLFALGVSALATALFGLLPALRGSRPDLVNVLKDDGGGSVGQRKSWLRSSLVVAQVSLSLVLLIAAGLLLRSLEKARNADPGFDPRNVLVAGIDLVPNGYDAARGRIALRQITERISALPGVTAVSTIRRVPLGLGGSSSSSFDVDGYVPRKDEEMRAYTHIIGPDYFHAMNTRLLAGREFTPADADQTQKVVVINQTFAERYFPKMDPIGRTVRIYRESRVIAGVAKDSKFFSLNDPPAPAIYFPVAQVFSSEANFLVRTSGDPLAQARAVQGAVRAVDPALPVFGVRDLQTAIAVAYFGQRMGGSLLGFFGALALGLAAVGIYGVLAYAVSQRSREIGIRMALGASRGNVLRLILGQGMNLALIGLGIGLGVAFAVTRLMSSMLFGVSATDGATVVSVSALLLGVVLAASYLPARRATRIDPIQAIRYE